MDLQPLLPADAMETWSWLANKMHSSLCNLEDLETNENEDLSFLNKL